MNRARTGLGAFKYVMGIAVVVTGTFGAFVFGERPIVAPRAVKAKRHPAHIDASAKPTVKEIECWDNLTKVEVPPGTKWVRITGKVCNGQVSLDEVRVTNETSHIVAMVLPLADGLTTDLIHLVEGANDLTFAIARPEGPVVGHLTLTR